MKPRTALRTVDTSRTVPIFLMDSSALICLLEGTPVRKAAVQRFLEEARAGRIALCVSAIVWMEVHAVAQGHDDQYRRLLSDSSLIETYVVDVAVAEEAARLRCGHGMDALDALHIATASVWDAAGILGNDARWRRCPECPPVYLVDELASIAEWQSMHDPEAQAFASWLTEARKSFG